MKHLIFIDTTSQTAVVDLPTDIDKDKVITGIKLIHWNVEGLPNDTGEYTLNNFYIQLKFSGAIQTRIVSSGRPDMIPIPIRSFGGWGISPHPIEIPVNPCAYSRTFTIEVFKEGMAPSPVVPAVVPGANPFRLVLWIEVATS